MLNNSYNVKRLLFRHNWEVFRQEYWGGYRLNGACKSIRIRAKYNCGMVRVNSNLKRSSPYYLEDVVTEFQIQGLEIDWACVTWDGDLRFSEDGWQFFSFVGTKWQHIRKNERQKYLLNAYRVLLTRARQGMILVVPRGDDEDPTRSRSYYDETFEYLASLGLSVI